MRILALDIGEKNIGLAMSDALGWTAQGLPTLVRKAKDEDIQAICALVKEYGVREIVAGLPLNLHGRAGRRTKAVAAFLEDLKRKLNLPIKVWDERLSTVEAERVLLQADLSRRKRKRKIDRLSAQLILQSYLDNRRCTLRQN